MSETWYGGDPPSHDGIGPVGYARFVLRAIPLILVVGIGLLLTIVLRLFEGPVFHPNRPMTPHITQIVCRLCLRIVGLDYSSSGRPMAQPGVSVANHSSWLDIFVLNARSRLYFVSKAEVASWPGIGWLARATGTVFIQRDRKQAAIQVKMMRERMAHGHHMLFFPEGTSTDGLQVLAFKPTLFAAFVGTPKPIYVQPITVQYHAPEGEDPRFYGWWGDMGFGPHLLTTLAARRHGKVHVTYHPELPVADFSDRKALAKAMEEQVRAGLLD